MLRVPLSLTYDLTKATKSCSNWGLIKAFFFEKPNRASLFYQKDGSELLFRTLTLGLESFIQRGGVSHPTLPLSSIEQARLDRSGLFLRKEIRSTSYTKRLHKKELRRRSLLLIDAKMMEG